MNTTDTEFKEISFVLVRLLREAIYREDKEAWQILRAEQEKVRHYFRQIGQELVLDESEGYAFLRQLEIDGMERIPRLAQRRPLTYHATLLLVCLREEFCRFDTSSPDSIRLTKKRAQLHKLVAAFLPETTNQVRDLNKIDAAIQKLQEFGFLEELPEEDTFEVKRLVKARLGPSELEAIKERLAMYAKSTTDE